MGRKMKTAERNCEYCGKLLVRKIFNGRLEDFTRFLKRRCCDVLCMAKWQTKEKVVRTAYHQRARKHRKEACEQCNSTSQLHVHHKDSDITNNVPANLITLCASCHLKWHWQNGKSGTKRLKKPCSVCGKPAEAKGYCQNHYRHFLKYGDPLLTKKSGRSDGTLIKENSS